MTLPASYAFMPNDAGVHTFTAGVILMTPGDQTLNVTDSNGLTGSAVITVVPQAPPGPAGGGKGAGGGLPIEDWRLQNETLQNERPVNLQSAICNPQWVAPWSERPSARRLALPGIEEAVDLLFAGGYERPAEMIGDGLVPKH